MGAYNKFIAIETVAGKDQLYSKTFFNMLAFILHKSIFLNFELLIHNQLDRDY